MLLPCDLPSIRQFVGELLSVLEEGELVILACPSSPIWRPWIKSILMAFEQTVHRKDGLSLITLPCLQGDIDNPLCEIAETLGCPNDILISGLLAELDGETLTILTVNCGQGISDGWQRLFSQLGNAYRTAAFSRVSMLVVLTECREFPPVEPRVGIRVRALWNVVRWEEFRLLVESMLPINENALVRAWRIAVYSAASSCNPKLASFLCREMPVSLAETIALAVCHAGSFQSERTEPLTKIVADRRWEVPPPVVHDWADGRICGISLERGASFNLGCMAQEDAKAYLFGAIWKEQIAGLLPVVMEMGFLVTRAITNTIGDKWLDGMDDAVVGPDGRVFAEPAEVIDGLKKLPKSAVPETILRTLYLLKSTRNDLAHMRPVDLGRIRELWQRYDLVHQRFGRETAGRPCRSSS